MPSRNGDQEISPMSRTSTASDAAPNKSTPVAGDEEQEAQAETHSSSESSAFVSPPFKGTAVSKSTPSSVSNSPRSSRSNSPTRQNSRAENGTKMLRSRKSSTDISPSRPSGTLPSGTTPSAAAIQRALSSAGGTALKPVNTTDSQTKIPAPQKTTGSVPSGTEQPPHWPSRLKSPSPSNGSRKNALLGPNARKPDSAPPTPSIVVKQPTPSSSGVSTPASGKSEAPAEEMEETGAGTQGSKPPTRVSSTLETVNEDSGTGPEENGDQEPQSSIKLIDDDRPAQSSETTEDSADGAAKATESGSDGGNKSDDRGRKLDPGQGAPKPRTVPAKNQYAPLASAKSRPTNDSATKNMTVETETVASIPQAALSAGIVERSSTRGESSGALRLKPSSETIRPKKDRKKTSRKAPSLQSGTVSSKADIFEAKVASAVDEVNSSDSDETFVYESNPPEPQSRPYRHHSRTPSATSLQGQLDPRGGVRSFGQASDGNRAPTGKRSMKFVNPYNNDGDSLTTDRQEGTVRSNRTGGGSGMHHHQVGRFGRTAGDQADSNSPLSPVVRSRAAGNTPQHHSRPATAGSIHFKSSPGLPSKQSGELSAYDVDMEGDNDERTPLMGTVRTPRGSRTPRQIRRGSLLQREYAERRSWPARCAGCLVIVVMLILVVSGAVGFLFATTKPLTDVGIREIQNVLASEQEIMFDLLVQAINPNVLAISIEDVDVNIFAKSKYLDTKGLSREHGNVGTPKRDSRRRRRTSLTSVTSDPPDFWRPSPPVDSPYHGRPNPAGGIDKGTDPIDDPSSDSSTMLLGRIFHFDTALQFDGSALKRHPHYSVGELRLPKPGNRTESGGSDRWEKVLEHPFELIVRGVLKYTLPLSGRVRTVAIGKSATVHPDENVGDGNMKLDQGKWGMTDGRFWMNPDTGFAREAAYEE